MKLLKLGIIVGVVTLGGVVFAQESEFQGKMQEDMDGYKAQLVEACGITDKVVMRYDGKLGSNPRETDKGNYTAVSTLCTSGLDAIHSGCLNNKVVKKALAKVTTFVCTKGKGTLDYAFKGSTFTFKVDPSYDKNNASGQEEAFETKLKKDLDK
ncbi:MAG: hypothetical protein ABJE66_29760 [Deltaproteobacteria bacterium]